MCMKKCIQGCALAALFAFISAIPSRADVIYDQAAWNATASHFTQAPYPFPVQIIDYLYTIQIQDPNGIEVVATSTPTGMGSFNSLIAPFDFGSACEFDPGCLITNDLEVVINLPTPIWGFSGNAIIGQDADFSINGDEVDHPGAGITYDGFLGLLGQPFSQIDIVSNTGFTDNSVSLFMNNITVLTAVDEPPASLLLLAALLMFTTIRYRRLRIKIVSRASRQHII
jgi:hypothetical protein